MAKKIELTAEMKNTILEMISKGNTDRDIIKAINISEPTYYKFMKEDINFFKTVKKAKRNMNKNVEAALYKRAMGYKYQEVIKEKDGNNENAKVKIKVIEKEMASDPTSMIFWLKNREKKKWRDRQEIDFKGKLNLNNKMEISDERIARIIAMSKNDGIVDNSDVDKITR